MWDEIAVDRADPRPLFQQIARGVTRLLAMRRIAAGTALPSVRDAAALWGVNLHTVRRAYHELADAGVLELRGTRGAFVAAASRAEQTLEAFVDATVAEARRRFGLDATGLSRAIHSASGRPRPRPTVWVVECTTQLCDQLVHQLRGDWEIRAEMWPLADLAAVPEGAILSTYFHYRELRAGLPHRLQELHFARMHYDAARVADMVAAAPAGAELLICNGDPLLTPLILAEACAALPSSRPVRAVAPAEAVATLDAGTAGAVLFTPATWDALDAGRRSSPLAAPLPLLMDRADLADLARLMGWRPRAAA